MTNLKTIIPGVFSDNDTYTLLEISTHFLEEYFNHSSEQSIVLLKDFLKNYSDIFDEDAIHHESSYRIAAIIHYLEGLKQPHNHLGDWMLKEGHMNPPGEAQEYFRQNYFS